MGASPNYFGNDSVILTLGGGGGGGGGGGPKGHCIALREEWLHALLFTKNWHCMSGLTLPYGKYDTGLNVS